MEKEGRLMQVAGDRKNGQTLAEYALILMCIALACLGAVTLLGGTIRGMYDSFNGGF